MKARIKNFIEYLQNQTYVEAEIDSEDDLKLLYQKWELKEKEALYFQLQRDLIAAGVIKSPNSIFSPSSASSIQNINQDPSYYRKFTKEETSSIDWLKFNVKTRTLQVQYKSASSSQHPYNFRVSAERTDKVIYDTFFNPNTKLVSYGRELNIWKQYKYLTKTDEFGR